MPKTAKSRAKLTITGLISGLKGKSDMSLEALKSLLFLAINLNQEGQNLVVLWFSNLGVTLLNFRNFLTTLTQNYLTIEPADLVSSMVFGGSKELSDELRQAFKVIGMQHVMAASGFNVGLMAHLCRSLLSGWCSRRIVGGGSLLAIWGYVVMAGGTASVVRAGLMLSLSVASSYLFFRPTKIVWLLGLTVGVMIGVNREYLTDIGFQLSVTSSLGLILVTPLLEKGSWLSAIETGESFSSLEEKSLFWRLLEPFKDAFFTTLAAQSLSLPLLWYHFGEISLLSLPANTFLLWITPLITLTGVAFMSLAGLNFLTRDVLEWPVLMLAAVLDKMITFFIQAVSWSGQFSSTLLEVEELEMWQVGGWWIVVLGVVWWLSRRQNRV